MAVSVGDNAARNAAFLSRHQHFMSVVELRMGAMSAGWGGQRRVLLERFVHGFEVFYPDDDLCTVWARIRADARASGRAISPPGRLDRRDSFGIGRPSRDEQSTGFRERSESAVVVSVTIRLAETVPVRPSYVIDSTRLPISFRPTSAPAFFESFRCIAVSIAYAATWLPQGGCPPAVEWHR